MNSDGEGSERARKYLEAQSCVIFSDISDWLVQIGSGTIVLVSGRYFVCTAGHVIHKCNMSQIKIGSQLLDHHFFTIKDHKIIGGDEDAKEDLAWIEVELPLGFVFNDIITDSDFYTGPNRIEDDYVVSGFPNELVKEIRKNEVNNTNLTHFTYITGPVSENAWEMEYDKNYHILLEYLRKMYLAESETSMAPTAWGISGGGIWYVDMVGKSLRLAGVQVGWDGPKEKIYGIKISEWHKFLRLTCPGL